MAFHDSTNINSTDHQIHIKMFKKKPNIKPLAPLRSSDRRKTADQIIKDLDLKTPLADTATEEEKKVSAAETPTLRNALLPDNALSARFTTTHGPDLKLVSGTVYVGSHNGEEQRVLWVKINERMYPSVYTLWHNPGILPLLHTGAFVVAKLQGGADLMTPGLYGGPPFPEKAKKGAIVAISSAENPSVPLVVGSCEIDVNKLQSVQGAKGIAVHTVHWSGDELWAWNPTGNSGVEPPEHMDGWLDEAGDMAKLAGQAEELNIVEGGGVSLEADVQDHVENAELEDEEEEEQMTIKEIDTAFHEAMLYGLFKQKSSNPKDGPTYGLSFPLTQSFVMSNLIQPFLPSLSSQLQIKKTSWKTMKKFLKSLDKEQILKTKDQKGNKVETVVLDIDFDDLQIQNFKPYRLPKREAPTASSANGKLTESDPTDSSVGQKLKLQSLYKAKEKLAPLFTPSEKDSRAFYTAEELRQITTNYIENEKLISETNKRFVKLNPLLANAVFDGKLGTDREILARGAVSREALVERVLSQCSQYHTITRISETTPDITPKPRAGAPPKVTITLETRSGNKTVTKLHGLEAFFISPQPLADELRKACAGSTSVERMQGSSPKAPVMEVMVQGPQRDAVVKCLTRRGIDAKWIDVVDKVKKKK
ncbi:eukaryotic translation initiation factor SUI1 family protein [Tothia fuscella]|uniref:Eukaryotic translation initiation factor SUI1 family protein n=1 Tax=Tothia fuscella TaxID=1048955 RepID=A0A9P4NGA3_9PEZI|nr:eukaryotic translation initiation factor SUI1 family protein [Tothia fuscella]